MSNRTNFQDLINHSASILTEARRDLEETRNQQLAEMSAVEVSRDALHACMPQTPTQMIHTTTSSILGFAAVATGAPILVGVAASASAFIANSLENSSGEWKEIYRRTKQLLKRNKKQ